jgi:hypothetical protein
MIVMAIKASREIPATRKKNLEVVFVMVMYFLPNAKLRASSREEYGFDKRTCIFQTQNEVQQKLLVTGCKLQAELSDNKVTLLITCRQAIRTHSIVVLPNAQCPRPKA